MIIFLQMADHRKFQKYFFQLYSFYQLSLTHIFLSFLSLLPLSSHKNIYIFYSTTTPPALFF